MIRYGRSSANGCGGNDGIYRDTGVCDNRNNGGGFDPPRWASTRSSAHAPTSTSTWTSSRPPVRHPFLTAGDTVACFNGRIIRCVLYVIINNASASFIRRVIAQPPPLPVPAALASRWKIHVFITTRACELGWWPHLPSRLPPPRRRVVAGHPTGTTGRHPHPSRTRCALCSALAPNLLRTCAELVPHLCRTYVPHL